ncbi:hypothetical protein KUTeg_014999 [Tegillarca granosa]|uniref:PHD-type domain-containing protein n=1 Tax=Tegillarca granosa TaxID=220873 RepID=A0ABQ9EU30_TEGGR|nr:hypothetical protein KUTeg_014999 [Tegillarca granosa]
MRCLIPDGEQRKVFIAQKEGLLSESAPEECMDIADPFFAYCKMHADKMTSRAKRRNWLAIQSYIRKHPEKEIEDEKERSRFSRKLNRHRQKYQIAKAKRPPSWVPTQKLVRHLTSSPSAVRKMLRKAELMGIITQVQHVSNEKQEVRKKSHISPALSVEFVAHYIERNTKIENMRTSIKELDIQNKKLQGQEQILRRKYDQLLSDMDKLKESTGKLKKDGEKMWNLLNDMSNKPLTLPEVFKTKKISTRPSSHITKPTSSSASVCLSPPAVINQCETCRKTHDQHMLVKCDNCKKHYHLGCLDPPLTRMPKKTANMGWQCSECDQSSSDEEEETDKNLDAPRRLREKIKEPMKWEPGDTYEYAKLTKQKNKTGKKQKAKTKKKIETDTVEKPLQKDRKEVKKEDSSSKEAFEFSSPTAKKAKIEEPTNDIVCAVCSKEGTNSTVVRCDECGLCYHFGCLDPPFKKTPKQRGYSWHCEACDPTDDSDDDDVEEDEETEKPLGKRIIKANIHFDD